MLKTRSFLPVICVAVAGVVVLCTQPPRDPPGPPGKSFSCQYFSDGTYTCHNEYRDKRPGDNVTKDDVTVYLGFNIVGLGQGTNGTWTPEDGIFVDYTPDGPRRFIGSCLFPSDSRPVSCTGPPTSTVDPLGRTAGKGGGVFLIPRYSGEPGGRIRAEQAVARLPTSANVTNGNGRDVDRGGNSEQSESPG